MGGTPAYGDRPLSSSAVNGLPRLGVDFGTSHTVAVCQWRDDVAQPLLFDASPLLPSAVLADGHGRLLVGRDAQRGARSDPASYEPYPKRRVDEGTILLGTAEVAVADVIAAVLHRCTAEAARVAGRPVAELVLTHPAAWGPRRRAVLSAGAARAGVQDPVLLAEPVAAAVYFTTVLGVRVPPGAAVVVYDLGAGTFDVAVVRREGTSGWSVLASDGFDDLGGVEFDALIVDGLRDQFSERDPALWQRLTNPRAVADVRARATLWEEARAAKEQLSRNTTAGVHVPLYEADVHVTRDEFERAARPLIERTVEMTAATLARAGLRPGEAAGLFLVGGATRIPQVAAHLHRRLGIAPTVIEQPELVVAQGAVSAVAAAPVPARPHPSLPQPVAAPTAAPEPGLPQAAPPQPAPEPTAPRPAPPQPVPPQPLAAASRRRGRLLVAAATVLVLAAGMVVYFLAIRDREPELTAVGRKNAAAFKSAELEAFARPWLNDLTNCRQSPPDTYGGRAVEYVYCDGPSVAVQFRAHANLGERDKSRENRETSYGGVRRDYTGEHPASGRRIDYQYLSRDVIYWDDDDSAMVGDLESLGATREQLLELWTAHVM